MAFFFLQKKVYEYLCMQVSTVTTVQWTNLIVFNKQVIVWLLCLSIVHLHATYFSFLCVAETLETCKTIATCTLFKKQPVINSECNPVFLSAVHIRSILPKCIVTLSAFFLLIALFELFTNIVCMASAIKKKWRKKSSGSVLILTNERKCCHL